MKKKLTEEEIISRIEDLNADPAELPSIIIRKEGDGYRCATGVPKVPLVRRSDGEGFVTTPVTAYGATEADAHGRLAQLIVQRLKWTCELLSVEMSTKDVGTRISSYLRKRGYRDFQVRIGGGILVDIGRRIPKEDFTRIAEITKGHELSIAHGVEGER
jgi:hypothetical protein